MFDSFIKMNFKILKDTKWQDRKVIWKIWSLKLLNKQVNEILKLHKSRKVSGIWKSNTIEHSKLLLYEHSEYIVSILTSRSPLK